MNNLKKKIELCLQALNWSKILYNKMHIVKHKTIVLFIFTISLHKCIRTINQY